LHRIQDVERDFTTSLRIRDENRQLWAEQLKIGPPMQYRLEDWPESVTHSLNSEDYK
jgi:hypothetical protein